MARTLIVVGDATTGGGRVVSGSPDTDIDGKAIARVGDKATCAKHKCVATIMSGDGTLVSKAARWRVMGIGCRVPAR